MLVWTLLAKAFWIPSFDTISLSGTVQRLFSKPVIPSQTQLAHRHAEQSLTRFRHCIVSTNITPYKSPSTRWQHSLHRLYCKHQLQVWKCSVCYCFKITWESKHNAIERFCCCSLHNNNITLFLESDIFGSISCHVDNTVSFLLFQTQMKGRAL